MLKALELSGFKSFAEKTRFEFPPGVTVIVGPNGSGKSNVVDAIKWVLGEQSVKSLRGKEMADVIFNGSAGRRALNAAEVTLTFDNTQRRFAMDTPDLHVTRRVYRSGEAEYLLNRQPCRLRDIRDMFSGTGIATEAYSIIEQGKVDVLLQASPRDRRMIFEEAAGISRFKIKKIDSLRRLERVEQNLLRLADIVEEVNHRLRSVRLQAAKAQKYKELADRLQVLRTQVGLADWSTLSRRLAEVEAECEAQRTEIAAASAQAELAEARALQLDLELAAVEERLRTHEARLHHNRQQIAVMESECEHERRRGDDLSEQVTRLRNQAVALSVRAGDVVQRLAETDAEVSDGDALRRTVGLRLSDTQRALTALTTHVDQLRNAAQQRRAEHREVTVRAAALLAEISQSESQLAAATAICDRNQRRLREVHGSREFLKGEAERLRARQAELQHNWEACGLRQAEARQHLENTRRRLAEEQQALSQVRQSHAGAVERTRLLDELERRLEGIHAGVKELLLRARSASAGPLSAVRGLVADLLRVPVELAPIVEIALGERAQYVVVDTRQAVADVLHTEGPRLAGRVGFLPLDASSHDSSATLHDLARHEGVLGRLSQIVEADAQFQPLAEHLLGRTWLVESFGLAVSLSTGIGRGQAFLTRKGELIQADGAIVAGPRSSGTGLISRRSELRALKQQVLDLEQRITGHEQQAAALEQESQTSESAARRIDEETQQATAALAEQRQQVKAAEERLAQLAQQSHALEEESARAAAEAEAARAAIADRQQRRQQADATLTQLQSAIDADGAELEQHDAKRQQLARQAAADQVELAKSQQRLEDLLARRRQFEQDQQERQNAVRECHRQASECEQRRQQAERAVLAAEAALADLYLQKESLASETGTLSLDRDARRQDRTNFSQEAQRLRNRLRRIDEKLHKRELTAGEIRHERTTLADRLREDYRIELAELERTASPEETLAREEVEQEIADLRQKLNQLGGVNLDALTELDELESRHATLSGQHADLSEAKAALAQIIDRINSDSRRLFGETLETVRGHFQNLFRKLFGGGQADIVLEEGEDILDGGIEIVARPPGKELRSISLMSGGEKTLTAVALLLAIFRSRPSPFCVLDEVDAALDEANIGRFIEVLKEFLAWTQFVVVTHSKKTMTCADTLYGVTMQESGVSKRVSVRFEDVTETGEIRVSTAAPAKDATAPNDSEAA